MSMPCSRGTNLRRSVWETGGVVGFQTVFAIKPCDIRHLMARQNIAGASPTSIGLPTNRATQARSDSVLPGAA